jgi:hypothetical protein
MCILPKLRSKSHLYRVPASIEYFSGTDGYAAFERSDRAEPTSSLLSAFPRRRLNAGLLRDVGHQPSFAERRRP